MRVHTLKHLEMCVRTPKEHVCIPFYTYKFACVFCIPLGTHLRSLLRLPMRVQSLKQLQSRLQTLKYLHMHVRTLKQLEIHVRIINTWEHVWVPITLANVRALKYLQTRVHTFEHLLICVRIGRTLGNTCAFPITLANACASHLNNCKRACIP